MVEEPNYRETEFNSSLATLMRCDEIKKWLAIDKDGEDYKKMYRHLLAFFAELYPILKKENREKMLAHHKHCRMQYLACRRGDPYDPWAFHQWEFDLRDLEQHHGMNLTIKRDPRMAMLTK